MAWSFWYVSIVSQDFSRTKTLTMTTQSVNEAVQFSQQLQVWLYAGIINTLFIGIRILKYMNLHASLRIYARVLSRTWRTLRDFLFFFLYILFLLGLCVLAFFQISGGNPLFVTIQGALQGMALMTFGFMDFPTFYNRGESIYQASMDINIDRSLCLSDIPYLLPGLGLGTWQPTIVIVFWFVVATLIVISQNIILSIVVSAYEEAKRTEPFIEASILSMLYHRTVFEIMWTVSKWVVLGLGASYSRIWDQLTLVNQRESLSFPQATRSVKRKIHG